MVIVRNKTASLFAACCHAGSLIGNHSRTVQMAMKDFGLNFGVAFQIIDDCRDIIKEEETLGKEPGQDVISGDVTLPLLTLFEVVSPDEKKLLKNMFKSRIDEEGVRKIRQMLVESEALSKTRQIACSYLDCAKERLNTLDDSDYRKSLSLMADYIQNNA